MLPLSLQASDLGSPDNIHLQQAVSHFNAQVSPQDSLTVEAVLNTPPQQKALSLKLNTRIFQALVPSASPANKAHMLSVSAPPCKFLGLCHPLYRLEHALRFKRVPSGYQMVVRPNTTTASSYPFCPGAVLDPRGHHATSCQHGGDVVTRHNHLRDTFAELCHRAHLPVRVEVG